MARLIFLIIFIYSFISINTGSLIFLIIASAFNVYILICQFVAKLRPVNFNKIEWTEEERGIIKKYNLYFRYPFASRSFSATASGIYIFGGLLSVWLIFHSLWAYAIWAILNAFIAALMRIKLDPIFVLHDAVERRHKTYYLEEMKLLDSVSKKMFFVEEKINL